jgi:hypothetical protein
MEITPALPAAGQIACNILQDIWNFRGISKRLFTYSSPSGGTINDVLDLETLSYAADQKV